MDSIPPSKRDGQASIDRGDVGFIILSAGLVSFMVPGLAFLYAGLVRRKSALSLIWAVCASNAIVIVQWYLLGYSLAFSPTATNGFIGNFKSVVLRGVLDTPSPSAPLIPELLFSLLQMEFATVTIGILMGAVAERGRVIPAMVFSFLWVTFVYCPITYWVWSVHGWASTWGVLDYAGGGPVEIGSGVAGLAYSLVLGRRQANELSNFRPHSVSLVSLGTFILWFGWIGFNAGSAYGANMRAVVAAWNTFICAAFGGITWCFLHFCIERKYTTVGLCCGTIAGLVVATPSSGNVPLWSSIILGIVAGTACYFGTKIKFFLHIDDALDLFAAHAICGMVGLLGNGVFCQADIVALDGVTIVRGGGLNHNWKQLYKQVAYIGACSTYTFVMTIFLCNVLDTIPGLRLRASQAAEKTGMDEYQIGEFASDYIEVRRDFLDGVPKGAKLRDRSSTPDVHETTHRVTELDLRRASLHVEQSTKESVEKKYELPVVQTASFLNDLGHVEII